MRTLLLSLVASTLCFSLGSCSTPPPKRKLDLPRNEIATLHGIDDGMELLGLSRRVVFIALDGERFDEPMDEIDVTAGVHTVGVQYSTTVDDAPGPAGHTTVEIDAHAGRSYRVKLDLEEGDDVRITFVHVPAPRR